MIDVKFYNEKAEMRTVDEISSFELKIKQAFDLNFDIELRRGIKSFYQFNISTQWRKMARIGKLPNKITNNFRLCNNTDDQTEIFHNHIDLARNILFVDKSFTAACSFNVTICMSKSISTQLVFKVLEEHAYENINCTKTRWDMT